MRVLKIIQLFLFFAYLPAAFAQEKPCIVSVKYFYKTGASDVKKYELIANGKTDCAKKSEFYEKNTLPQNLEKKEVSFKWKGR